MSDTPRDEASLLRTAKPRAARVARPGETAWRFRNAAGRIQRCELRNHAEAGAGVDILLFEGDDLLFSRRADGRMARYAATAAKQDLLRTGWTDDAAGETRGA